MSSNDIILRVNHISKCFEIYEKPIHRLYQILHDRKKFYKEFWALKDISFEVKRGECIGIIGRNGAGKSTTIRSMLGLIKYDQGEIRINGLDSVKDREKILADIGYMPSEAWFYPGMKIREILKYSAASQKG